MIRPKSLLFRILSRVGQRRWTKGNGSNLGVAGVLAHVEDRRGGAPSKVSLLCKFSYNSQVLQISQSLQMAYAHRTVPPGWAPPFQGPPPKPAHMNVNQQQWNAGHWKFNSAFANHPPQHKLPWQPGQAWPQMSHHFQAPPHQQQQPSYNPYKKPIREPSAEYMASKLSDNPLGLHNLVPVYVSFHHTLRY
jgi:hypothetical protein